MADINPFLDDEDEDETPQADNTNFKQLRDYAKKLEKEKSKADKELASLRDFKSQADQAKRQAEVAQVFGSVGLSEKHSALFLKINPDGEVTAEDVAAFAEEYELPRQEAAAPAPVSNEINWAQEQVVEIKPETKSTGFAPTDGAQAPSARIVTDLGEAEALSVSNPQEYARLRQAGRIQLQRLPGSSERIV